MAVVLMGSACACTGTYVGAFCSHYEYIELTYELLTRTESIGARSIHCLTSHIGAATFSVLFRIINLVHFFL